MRLPIAVFAGLLLSATLSGCGASATIPAPPATPTAGPPPGTSPEMVKAPKSQFELMQGAAPAKKK